MLQIPTFTNHLGQKHGNVPSFHVFHIEKTLIYGGFTVAAPKRSKVGIEIIFSSSTADIFSHIADPGVPIVSGLNSTLQKF